MECTRQKSPDDKFKLQCFFSSNTWQCRRGQGGISFEVEAKNEEKADKTQLSMAPIQPKIHFYYLYSLRSDFQVTTVHTWCPQNQNMTEESSSKPV